MKEEFYHLFPLHVKDDTASNGSGFETIVYTVRFGLVSSSDDGEGKRNALLEVS